MIYLTSFSRSRCLPNRIQRWSAAVYQPKGFDYSKAQCFDIRNKFGNWIRPREFISKKHPLLLYRKALLKVYKGRANQILRWLNNAAGPTNKDIALCCWCPNEKAAQRQLNEWGSFVCHLSVVGEYLADYTEELVWYDSDRLSMAVLTQKEVMSKMNTGKNLLGGKDG